MRLILLILLVTALPQPLMAATVTRIVDGDTLILDDTIKIRLYGIDSPENGQPGEREATEAATALALGQRVEVEEQYQDRYGRTVAIIILGNGNTLQEALLQKGMAWVAPRYCKRHECVYWKDLEQAARLSQIGIWQDERVIPPWEWRRRNRDSRESK